MNVMNDTIDLYSHIVEKKARMSNGELVDLRTAADFWDKLKLMTIVTDTKMGSGLTLC